VPQSYLLIKRNNFRQEEENRPLFEKSGAKIFLKLGL
jgi:hypothetical protein